MLKIYGEHDDNTIKQMWQALGTGSVHAGVLCADGHYGYAHPIGGVIAYEDHISVSGVGFDIACGNLAVKLDLGYDAIAPRLPTIARDIGRKISFGLGRANQTRVEHELFDDGDAWQAAGADHHEADGAGAARYRRAAGCTGWCARARRRPFRARRVSSAARWATTR